MNFFCSKCQKRHDVRDISADMWTIYKDKIKEGVTKVLNELIENADGDDETVNSLNALFNDMIRLFNISQPMVSNMGESRRAARINALFALNRNNIRRLSNAQSSVDETNKARITGEYSLTLGFLLTVYSHWTEAEAETDCVPAASYETEVFRESLIAHFTENGVLDKVTDLENVPFEHDGKMLGFVHICPHCGCILSRASGTAEEIVVALAGSPRAGKTSCMVAMFNSLLNGRCPGVRVIPMAHDEKWAALSNDISDYAGCVKVRKTPNAEAAEVPAHSVLIQIDGRPQTKRVLTMVDMAGEFWEGGSGLTEEFFRAYADIYENIDCIWFVISKATVHLSQAGFVPEEVKDRLAADASEDMEIIRTSNPQNLSVNLSMLKSHLKKHMPPVMVIVSKPDHMISALDEEKTAQYRLFPEDRLSVANCNISDLMRVMEADRNMHYSINQQPLRNHADNVRAFVGDICSPYLSAIEDNCPDRFYCSLSPYGRPAEDSGNGTSVPIPYHELYPFLWTLAIHGALRVGQNVRWLKRNFLGGIASEEYSCEPVLFTHTRRYIPLVKGRDSRRIEDINTIYSAISNNLLINGSKYMAEAVIGHERE